MSTLTLAIHGPCPRSTNGGAHTWQSRDPVHPISLGDPDHGVTVYLGRYRSGAVPPLAAVAVSESFCGDRVVLEDPGAPR
jgi:hypothetical protein